jgi:hypothetical protein
MTKVIPRSEIVMKLMEDSKEFKKHIVAEGPVVKIFDIGLPNRGRSMEQVFFERTSYRFFNPNSEVDIEDLKTILLKNHQYYIHNWNDDRLVQQYIIGERVNHTSINARTIYRYCPDTNDLSAEGYLPENVSKKMLFLQQEFADAPVVLLFVGELAKAVEKIGTAGYKNLLMRSGAVAHYSWLQSMSMGYQGTVFAGVLPKMFKKFCSIDGYRKCQMFAYAFGN